VQCSRHKLHNRKALFSVDLQLGLRGRCSRVQAGCVALLCGLCCSSYGGFGCRTSRMMRRAMLRRGIMLGNACGKWIMTCAQGEGRLHPAAGCTPYQRGPWCPRVHAPGMLLKAAADQGGMLEVRAEARTGRHVTYLAAPMHCAASAATSRGAPPGSRQRTPQTNAPHIGTMNAAH
jgi:hypothetical protein